MDDAEVWWLAIAALALYFFLRKGCSCGCGGGCGGASKPAPCPKVIA